MLRLRRRLPWIAAVSLVFQVAVGGVSLSAMARALAPGEQVVCTCVHGSDGHEECPMHHTASGEARCLVRGMDDAATSALSTLLAPTAALTRPMASFIGAPSAELSNVATSFRPLFSTLVPDLRPPRL